AAQHFLPDLQYTCGRRLGLIISSICSNSATSTKSSWLLAENNEASRGSSASAAMPPIVRASWRVVPSPVPNGPDSALLCSSSSGCSANCDAALAANEAEQDNHVH